MLKNIDHFNLPAIEEKILNWWEENKVFEKSLEKNKNHKKFVFFEGPPTANGKPGIHHILARSFKDIILRFKTMSGFYVPRKSGWDTHGLPVELEVEKTLGFKTKKDIEQFGIAEFNKLCKESVWSYKKEWENITKRIGFWLDLQHPYITYTNRYIETLWWIIKKIWNKKLFYQDYKIVHWCPRCGTSLSSHEVAQGYDTVTETSVFIKFKLLANQKIGNTKINDHTFILSWTTTPWTLPGNVALAINPKIKYVKIEVGNEFYILAEKRLVVINQNYKIIQKYNGSDLIGLRYEPLFYVKKLKSNKSYKIYPADFVSVEDGTGVVHTAVMYGEEDFQLGKKIGLPQYHTVNEQGKFIAELNDLAGLYVKDLETENKILNILVEKNYLLKKEAYTHEYPFCWRCKTPLLYYAKQSWFVGMSKVKDKLIANNKKINWIPEYIKNGRFGEWLRDIKDWNFSRARFWGTPLPVWQCKKCGNQIVIDSRKTLAEQTGKSTNHYFVLRHGESETLLKNIVNCNPADKDLYPLTLKGINQIENIAKKLQDKKIDLIFSSDFLRTKQTAEIIAKKLNKKVIFDSRLREINVGDFNGGNPDSYHKYFENEQEKFYKNPPHGENLNDLAKRVYEFLNDVETKYKNKKILIVSHEYTIWMILTVAFGWDEEEALLQKHSSINKNSFIQPAQLIEFDFYNLPRNQFGICDLHRPFIDEIKFKCIKCKGIMERIPELADVWFDSGSMPFAQNHYPFDFKKQEILDFPADYISEGIDQTRGWFYTLLAVSTLLDKGPAYKNVITLGLVLDKNGQKMSKSKGNIVDPWSMINKYGSDVVRWYFYSVNAPADAKKFDEQDLVKIFRQFVSIIYNSYVFYWTYVEQFSNKDISKEKLNNILDRWLLVLFNKLVKDVTNDLKEYDVYSATRKIYDFVDNLSRWYIRRSRRRFQKPISSDDYEQASAVLGYVLLEFSKLIAPFMPFFAESLYQTFDHKKSLSVHLENWPKVNKLFIDDDLLFAMNLIQKIASNVLAKRSEAGIKLRQPLGNLQLNVNLFKDIKLTTEDFDSLIQILSEEINVKDIDIKKDLAEEFILDTRITHELLEEGIFRDLVRIIQDFRQDSGLQFKDNIDLMIEGSEEIQHIINKFEKKLKNEVNAKNIELKKGEKFTAELQTKINDSDLWIGLRKI
ncbi:MAG: class I tRNA ligase family protein [Minisyncoccia bacterium]